MIALSRDTLPAVDPEQASVGDAASVPLHDSSSCEGGRFEDNDLRGLPRPDDLVSPAGVSCCDDGPSEGFFVGVGVALAISMFIWVACFAAVWLVKEWMAWLRYF